MRLRAFPAPVLFAILLSSFAAAQDPSSAPTAGCQPQWLPTFGPQPGVGGSVKAQQVFDDGSGPALYVGGTFLVAGGVPISRLAKWDGAHWSALGSGLSGTLNGSVSALAVFDDGSGAALYAGGQFALAGGVPANLIAKWNGSSWSALAGGIAGVNGAGVRALAVFDDGSGPALYAGGRFTSADGAPANSIARWDGSSWSALGLGMGGANSPDVEDLVSFDDGSGPALYAAGTFTSAGGTTASHIAKWDGSHWSALGSGVNGTSANALTVHDDGSGPALYVGGLFGSAGGVLVSGIARWNASGWSALGSGLGPTSNGVDSLASFDDGSGAALYIGGSFASVGGAQASGIARWDGTQWSVLGSGIELTSPNPSSVLSLCAFDEGSGPRLFAGGTFLAAGGMPANGIARWGGGGWSTIGTGVSGTVNALARFDDGSGLALYSGGFFRGAGGELDHSLARWDGSHWNALGRGVVAGTIPGEVRALAVFDDGSGPALVVGGRFSRAGDTQTHAIAKWDGSNWSALPVSLTTSELVTVDALCVFDDGSGPALFVGGDFTTAGGVPAVGVAKWNGTSWSALGTGLSAQATVACLAVHDDGAGPALYVGGSFSTAGGQAVNGLARWNGQQWSAVGNGVSGYIGALLSFDSGSGPTLYAGGSFTFAGAAPLVCIASWNGSQWSGLGSGLEGHPNRTVNALCAHDDGGGAQLYVGGFFWTAGGQSAYSIARWDGNAWSALGNGVASATNMAVNALATFDQGGVPTLVVGGSFLDCPDSGDSYLAAWGRPSGCWSAGLSICEPGNGGVSACPCANPPSGAGRGCDNSSATGGAQLTASGAARIANDTLVLATSAETATATSVVLQGDALNASGVVFGQGVRCVAGSLKRLYVKTAVGGSITAPGAGDASISARSAALGDMLVQGTHRYYGVFYRDPTVLGGCPSTSTFNITQQLDVLWQP
jgi:trimeric autotransporter adhesin